MDCIKAINREVEHDFAKSFLKNENPTDILKGSMLGFLDSILILREGILFLFQQIKKHEDIHSRNSNHQFT